MNDKSKAIQTYSKIGSYSMGDDMNDKKTNQHAKNVIDSIMANSDKDTKSLKLSESLYDDILNVIKGDKYVGCIEVVTALGVLDLVKYDLMNVMVNSGDEQV